ncbi:phosphoribosylanthranilate isomerase [Stenoxybacter acetivorans]|uniref:phosphoribosylanthranilate isomerase n=1 Tax=Stenoxybacter acetivorans TaxID=422441 RepID=UPI00056D550E|nr:phosphoribosylanthranilate isomerase [Stenoxybacter acetivorans]
MKIRVKICGITRVEDAVTAADAGVDAIGLVFFSGSRRCVSIEQAQKIVHALPPFVSAVGLFVNADATEVNQVLNTVPLDILQFHGDETPAFCRQFARPFMKAIRVKSREDIQAAAEHFPDARALLFDAYVHGQFGGTGQCFDWQMLPENLPCAWVLSGGLNEGNIKEALAASGAAAVDISSGAESSAGIKDAIKIRALMRAIRAQENTENRF